jgi:hypothetical protein
MASYPDAADSTIITVVDGLVGVVVDEHAHTAVVYTEDVFTRCALQGRRLLDSTDPTSHEFDCISDHLVSLPGVTFLFILGVVMANPAREVSFAASSKQITA